MDIPRTIEVDLHGNQLTQAIVDWLLPQVNLATREHGTVSVVVKGIAGPVSRLIVDRDDIYEVLSELLRQRRERR